MRGDGSIAPAWSQLGSRCSFFPSCSGCFVDLDRLSCSIATLAFCNGSCSGRRSSSSTVARRWAGAAPRSRQRHSPRCRPHRHQRRHPRCHRRTVQSIHSTVPSTQRTHGLTQRRGGVAKCTTVVVSCHQSSRQCCLRSHRRCDPLPILTIAQTVLPIGRLVGVWARNIGAARCTARAALARAMDV